MIQIELYKNMSESIRLSKKLEHTFSLNGELTTESSIFTPSILVEGDSDIMGSNYLYVPEFGRYYFITNITVVRTDIYLLNCRCDVLYTYREEIRKQKAIISKCADYKSFNTYLDDGTFRVYQDAEVVTQEFPNGFSSESFILSVAGSSEVI